MLRLMSIFFFLLTLGLRDLRAQSASPFDQLQNKVRLVTLQNGLRVIIYRRGEAPVFAGSVVVRVGGVDESPGLTGISHMFEHMAFKGTSVMGTRDFNLEKQLLKKVERLRVKESEQGSLSTEELAELHSFERVLKSVWKTGELAEEIERRGGVGLNAQTTNDATTYYVDLPSSQLEFFLQLESNRILDPVLREFYQERDVVLEERRMRVDNSPEGLLYEKLLGSAYRVHPYHRPVIGYEQDIRRLTATKVEDFRKRYYVPSNMVLALVGDIDPESAIPLVKKYFERIPAGTAPAMPEASEPKQNEERRFEVSGDYSPHLAIAYHKVQYPDPDGAALAATLSALASSKTSWLYDKLVTKEKLVSEAGAYSEPGYLYPDLAIFWLTPIAPHTNQEVLKRFDQIVEEFKSKGPTAEQLSIVKKHIQLGLLERLASNNALARDLAENEALFGDWRATFKEYQQLLKLEAGDIKRVSDKFLVNTERTVGFLERRHP